MYDMEYKIICNDQKYKIQYRRWKFWFWEDLPIISLDISFNGIVAFYDLLDNKDFESYQGALQYLRQYLGREVIIKETILI
jgi:hypothetical protein